MNSWLSAAAIIVPMIRRHILTERGLLLGGVFYAAYPIFVGAHLMGLI